MRPTVPLSFEETISKPRLDSYRHYFRASRDEAIGLYMWNGEVSSCLGALLSYFEVALRNRIHRTMSEHYSRGASNSIHWYDTIRSQLTPGIQEKITRVRTTRGPGGKPVSKKPAPNPDEVVSRVTFGFWSSILGVVDTRYADQLFPKIFPNHPLNVNPSDWAIKQQRKQALGFIYELNELRNRIAHHEPLWKFSAIKDTSIKPAIVLVAESTDQASSIQRFTRLLDLFDQNVRAISTDLYVDLKISSWRTTLDFLLTDRGVNRYRKQKHVPASAVLSPAELHRSFSLVGKSNQPVRIAGRSRFKGLFTPE